ncbi:hypothetical protein AKO1_004866, partial [Acrasis kona]
MTDVFISSDVLCYLLSFVHYHLYPTLQQVCKDWRRDIGNHLRYNTDVLDLINPLNVQNSTETSRHLTDFIKNYSPKNIKLMRLYSLSKLGHDLLLFKEFQSLECLDLITFKNVYELTIIQKALPSLKRVRITSMFGESMYWLDEYVRKMTDSPLCVEVFFYDPLSFHDSYSSITIHQVPNGPEFYIQRFHRMSLREGLEFNFRDAFIDTAVADFVFERIKVEDLRGYTQEERLIKIPSLHDLTAEIVPWRSSLESLKNIIFRLAQRDESWINAHETERDMTRMLSNIQRDCTFYQYLIEECGLSTRSNNVNPLYVAKGSGHSRVVDYLIEKDPELLRLGEMTNKEKKHSLLCDSQHNDYVCKTLLLNGQDFLVSEQDYLNRWIKDNGALLLDHGQLLSLHCWFDYDYNINKKQKPPIYVMVKRFAHDEKFPSFLKCFPKGAFKDCKTPSGKTLLHPLFCNQVEVAQTLIYHHNVSFLDANESGFSFLDLMLRCYDRDVCQMFDMLISNGLEIHGETNSVLLISMFINKHLCCHLIREHLIPAGLCDGAINQIKYKDVLCRVFRDLKVTTSQLFDNYKQVFNFQVYRLVDNHIAVFDAFDDKSSIVDNYCAPYLDQGGSKKSLFMNAINHG